MHVYEPPFHGGAHVVVYYTCSCQCSSAFCLCLNFCSFYLPPAGKKLSFRLNCLTLCRLNCLYSFPVWCLSQVMEFDCKGS